MKSLELRIPPPAITALIAAAMLALSWVTPSLQIPTGIRLSLALALALVGIGFCAAGVISFRCAKTTINPMTPQLTSSLVRTGIYTITRNPMYVGFLIILIAFAIVLSSAWALLGPVAYVFYIGRFQIAPEERSLTALFGSEYTAYVSKVRRWL